MAKQWLFSTQPEYVKSLRHVVSDSDRYPLGVAIREALKKAEDPTTGTKANPTRPDRFTLVILNYIVTFEVPLNTEGKIPGNATTIKLLPIEIAS